MVKEGEQGLGSAKGHISSLKEAQEKLLEELDATRARLRETTNLLAALQVWSFSLIIFQTLDSVIEWYAAIQHSCTRLVSELQDDKCGGTDGSINTNFKALEASLFIDNVMKELDKLKNKVPLHCSV